MKFLNLFMIITLIVSLALTGCGKKPTVAAKPKIPAQPTTYTGFGSIAGVCSVCKTKSNYLLAVRSGEYNALVCSQGCGERFRAYPTYYGDHYTVTKTIAKPLAKGFGSIKGTCSVCGKKADDLLAVKVDTYNGTVCSMDCGGKFRANPAQYGKK
jgi:YHS domain-containing protein